MNNSSHYSDYAVISYAQLLDFTTSVFKACNMPAEDAKKAALVLVSADLKGIDSHGVARLSGYIRLWQKGRVNFSPNMRIIYQKTTTATWDADAALGLISAPKAMEWCLEIAEKYACAFASVIHSNHFGIAGFHANMAASQNKIGWAMTNASPLVAPTRSKERLLGTNPMAFAFPVRNRKPLLADFATTTAANGKLEILQRKNQPAPMGWLQDKMGLPTNDVNALKHDGALLPLGSDALHGSHKGFCLGAIVDLFSGLLGGANFGPWVPPFVAFLEPKMPQPGKGIGHFLGCWQADAFRPMEQYFDAMDQWVNTFLSASPIQTSEPVMLPGDPEHACEAERLKKGIPIIKAVQDDLNSLALQLNLDALF